VRLSDFSDWLALRRHLAEPWAFVRSRKHEMTAPVDLRFRDGAVVRLRPAPMDRHTFHRIFARDEYRLNSLPPGALGTVIDVGAHIGLFAVRVAPLAKRVLSFEPVADNFDALRRNVGHYPHVTPVCRAVAGRRGTATIYVSANPSAHSMHPAEADRRTGAATVETLSLADVFADYAVDRCDLLKLDCEGAEYEILDALPDDLWPRIARLVMEFHPVDGGAAGWTGPDLAKRLASRGFRVDLVPHPKHPTKGHLFAVR
jgi:FkbM family methyltransferase